jgi:HSP20 family molecular chaperone IbpA
MECGDRSWTCDTPHGRVCFSSEGSSSTHEGALKRSFRLPVGVKMDKVEAKFDKGILTITLPKTEEAKTKEIKVEVK